MHIILFKTDISVVKTIGLSGFAIGDLKSEEIENNLKGNTYISFPSTIIITIEWGLLFLLIILSSIKSKLAQLTQKNTHIELIKKISKSDTEIDTLYKLLQKNKKINLTKAAEIFKVDKKIIEEWGEILENNHLAIVDYPRFGEVEIRLNEETH